MTTTSPGEERVAKRAPGLRRAGRELLRNPPAVFGAVVLTVFVLVALFAPLIAPHNPRQQNLGDRFTPPCGTRPAMRATCSAPISWGATS